eukprot:308327-Chlamydomonas_euryale.AAC.1
MCASPSLAAPAARLHTVPAVRPPTPAVAAWPAARCGLPGGAAAQRCYVLRPAAAVASVGQ